MWNKAVVLIGSVKATNYIYFVPVITMVTSALFLKEKITIVMITGGILILAMFQMTVGLYNHYFK